MQTKPNPLTQRRCPVCEEIFDTNAGRGRQPIYCSKRCRMIGSRSRFCPCCDEMFELADDDPSATAFCSHECSLTVNRMRRAKTRICKLASCSQPLDTPRTSMNPQFCSQEHLNEWILMKMATDELGDDFMTCRNEDCERPVKRQDHLLRSPQKYCSDRCRQIVNEVSGKVMTRPIPSISTCKSWQVQGLKFPAIFPNLEATPTMPGRNDFPFENEIPANQRKILADGWTPEDYATVPGYISPALWRRLWGQPLPTDVDTSHITFMVIPARELPKINKHRSQLNLPPINEYGEES